MSEKLSQEHKTIVNKHLHVKNSININDIAKSLDRCCFYFDEISEEEATKIQTYLFSIGYAWRSSGKEILIDKHYRKSTYLSFRYKYQGHRNIIAIDIFKGDNTLICYKDLIKYNQITYL